MRYSGISQQDLNKIGINGRFINVSCNVYIVSVHEHRIPGQTRITWRIDREVKCAPASETDVMTAVWMYEA